MISFYSHSLFVFLTAVQEALGIPLIPQYKEKERGGDIRTQVELGSVQNQVSDRLINGAKGEEAEEEVHIISYLSLQHLYSFFFT